MQQKRLYLYLVKFLAIWAILYYGSQVIIGFAAPGGYYNEFVHQYLDYSAILRKALMNTASKMLALFHWPTEMDGPYKLRVPGGGGVKVVYSCLGIGIMSFWIAFILANEATIKKKMLFLLGGLSIIFFVNAVRIALLVLSANKKIKAPFGLDHHTLFAITAYGLIIFMMILFDKTGNSKQSTGKA